MTNNVKLKEHIKTHHLTRQQAADMMKVSLKTVHSWLAPPGTKEYRAMSDMALKLLELKFILKLI